MTDLNAVGLISSVGVVLDMKSAVHSTFYTVRLEYISGNKLRSPPDSCHLNMQQRNPHAYGAQLYCRLLNECTDVVAHTYTV